MTTPELIEAILGLVLLFIVLLPLYNAHSVIRSRRIAKVAQEFGLSFSKGAHLFNPLEAYRVKTNIISGSIKGHTVELYDSQMIFSRATARKSVIILDGSERPTPNIGKFLGLKMSADNIREYLSSI